MTSRRQIISRLLATGLFYPLVVHGKNSGNLFKKKNIVLNVVLYNYLNRPIFDIYLNGIDLGVANSYGGTGIITSVSLPLGAQTLTWRDAGSGETFTVKNSLNLSPNKISPNVSYLGVHIYADHTAEFTFSEHMPETTPRGRHIIEQSIHASYLL